MNVSKDAIEMIIGFEVSSKKMYETRYQQPIWPDGKSGITIGVGYDLGYASPEAVKNDWSHLDPARLNILVEVAKQKLNGLPAKRALDDNLHNIKSVKITWLEALTAKMPTLKRFYSMALQAYPGLDHLHPDAQGMILSLVYNRGISKSSQTPNEERREMNELTEAIRSADYDKIAELFRSMKRLWPADNQKGLRKRRDMEADTIQNCKPIDKRMLGTMSKSAYRMG